MMFIAASLFATPVLLSTQLQQRQSDNGFRWESAMTSGSTLMIRNVNGPVRVERATGNNAEVVATKTWRRGDPARVTIEAVKFGPGSQNAVVCAMWTANTRCSESGDAAGNRDQRDNSDNDVAVEFTVRLPAGVNARLHTINGEIAVNGATATVDASTVNGSIEITGADVVNASTVNGSVDATITAASPAQDIELKTVNGSVSARLPANINAQVSASTVMGSISSDFPVTVQGRMVSQSISTTLGSGGRRLNLSTVTGSITLRRR
jgi:hypothetical protein